MPYQNYRMKKEKGLAILTKKTTVNVVSVPGKEEEATEVEEAFFDLKVTMFDENFGTERGAPREYRVDAKSLDEAETRHLSLVEDIKELKADMKALEKKK